MVITLENGKIIQGSEVISATLRSSLEPIPLTFEADIKINADIAPFLLEKKIIKAGREQTAMRIVFAEDTIGGFNNDAEIRVRKIIALHNESSAIADNLTRAIIKENVSLGEIYKLCGGKSGVEKSFSIPRFYCYQGQTPSHLIARVCQEHGGVVRWLPKTNKIAFFRIYDLFKQKPLGVKIASADVTAKSDYLVRQEVCRYISTNAKGEIIKSENYSNNSMVLFTPNKTQTQLNAMTSVVLNAKRVVCVFSPDIHAGEIVEMGGVKMVILTAAHVVYGGEAPHNESVFWLGVQNAMNGENSEK